jgi:glycosyltransferase involved in cell wall biosynthesis
MKIALSMLCENPRRKTGLSTTYHEFVARSLHLFRDLTWVVFVGPDQEWRVLDPRVEVVRDFSANDQLKKRLLADHFLVPAVARARGADVMVSTGFVPFRKCLPTVMHVFSLQHLDKHNRIGFGRNLYRHVIMRFSWPRADLIIANSKFAVSQILGACPEFRDRLVQAYEGLRHEQFNIQAEPGEVERVRAAVGQTPGYFIWISNFYPYKQAPLLLAGYAMLDPALRGKHPLVMVGGDWEDQLQACRDRVKLLGIEQDVHFVGWAPDDLLAPLYRQALAHCMPSREETFGRTVIESMACGTPCLVNDIPIMHEVTAGQALIVDFRDTQRVAEALKRLSEDEALRVRLREGGLRRASDFSFEKFTEERILAIERFLSGRSKPTGRPGPAQSDANPGRNR